MHTPTPWTVCTDSYDNKITIEQDRMALEARDTFSEPTIVIHHVDDTGDGLNRLIAEANARRIVACVNACEGIEDVSAIQDLIKSCKQMLIDYEDSSDDFAEITPDTHQYWTELFARLTSQPRKKFNITFQRIEHYQEEMEVMATSKEEAMELAEGILQSGELSFDGDIVHGDEQVIGVEEIVEAPQEAK